MFRTVRHAIWITGLAIAVLLVPRPAAAATNRPAGEGWDRPRPTIERVEVPVDDGTTEAAQMMIAAALAAALTTAAGRRRSRRHLAPTTPGLIDITGTVQL